MSAANDLCPKKADLCPKKADLCPEKADLHGENIHCIIHQQVLCGKYLDIY